MESSSDELAAEAVVEDVEADGAVEDAVEDAALALAVSLGEETVLGDKDAELAESRLSTQLLQMRADSE